MRKMVCKLINGKIIFKNYFIDNVYIKKDWDRYAGNMKAKNEQYGSPLGISIEGISTTPYEEYENAMIEIGKRKKNKKSYT